MTGMHGRGAGRSGGTEPMVGADDVRAGAGQGAGEGGPSPQGPSEAVGDGPRPRAPDERGGEKRPIEGRAPEGDRGGRRAARWWWRRVVVAVVASLAVIVAVAAGGWFLWFPHYRPALRDGERYGIDVAHHQGGIDWARVAADDIGFAYIKATEGADHVDRRFADNWEGAGTAGLDRGAYHFFTLCTPGRAQAEHFLRTVPDTGGTLPPAVDLELAGNCAARPPGARVRAELDEFLAVVEAATGRRTVLYVGDDFESVYPVRAALDRPLWHRRIFWRADVDGWWIWQFTGRGQVDGIPGPVDINVMRGEAPRRPPDDGSSKSGG